MARLSLRNDASYIGNTIAVRVKANEGMSIKRARRILSLAPKLDRSAVKDLENTRRDLAQRILKNFSDSSVWDGYSDLAIVPETVLKSRAALRQVFKDAMK